MAYRLLKPNHTILHICLVTNDEINYHFKIPNSIDKREEKSILCKISVINNLIAVRLFIHEVSRCLRLRFCAFLLQTDCLQKF